MRYQRLRDESGQSIILVSIIILSFLMFFSFALNTGLLINAKISVQAAADAAAYAGAATQARQLNAISYLNYDMRRQYKKFLFRNTFVGSMGSVNFPTSVGNSGNYDFPKLDYLTTVVPKGQLPLKPMNVPVVCIPITPKGVPNDNCTFVNMRDTTAVVKSVIGGTATSLNPITQTLIDNLQKIGDLQAKLCEAQGSVNMFALISWLFRADPSPTGIQSLLSQFIGNTPDFQNISATISALVTNLGLFPRNIITKMRIDTLQEFINDPHHTEVDLDQLGTMEHASEPAKHERTIQAYRSAASNLNSDIFDPNLTKIDEMNADAPLSLESITVNFNTYIQQTDPNKKQESTKGVVICPSTITNLPIVGAPIGVKLGTNSKQVNYALRVRAFIKPHGLLFLPKQRAPRNGCLRGSKTVWQQNWQLHLCRFE